MAKTKESVMTQIMKLLNLAADEGASQHERELASERAERLMEQHMIDRMDLKPEEKGKIIVDEWELNIGLLGQQNYEYMSNMVQLMSSVLKHTGCRMNYNYSYKSIDEDKTDYKIRIFKVVGFPEDIQYAERVWFRIYKEFVMNVNPHWLPGKDKLGENVYNYQRAGMKWIDIGRAAYRYQEEMRATSTSWSYLTPAGRAREVHQPPAPCPALKAAAKEYCASIGQEYQSHTQRHEAYRTSFARSYASTIGTRLRRIRDEAHKAKDGEDAVDSNKFAIALRDTQEQVDEEFYRLFPEYDPRVQKRKQEERDMRSWLEAERIWQGMSPAERLQAIEDLIKEQRQQEARERREEARYRRNFYKVRNDTSYDSAAWDRGRKVAERVNLRNDGEVHKPNTKELS